MPVATRASRRAASNVAPVGAAYSYRPMTALFFDLPDEMHDLGGNTIPMGRHDEGKEQVVEAARWFLGSDELIYVIRYRDRFRKQLIGENPPLSQEAALVYRGKSISRATAAMNEALTEFSGKTFAENVGGRHAATRDKGAPYTAAELIDDLETLLDSPENDPTKRVMNSYHLKP